MIQFFLEFFMIVSVSVIIYLIARTIPEIDERDIVKEKKITTSRVSLMIEEADDWIKALSEKGLRKLKVHILKLDNSISYKLNQFKKEEENGERSIIDSKPEETTEHK